MLSGAKSCTSCRSRQELSNEKPKDGCRKKEAKEAAPGRRKKASSEDHGTQKQKKARVAPKRKVKPG